LSAAAAAAAAAACDDDLSGRHYGTGRRDLPNSASASAASAARRRARLSPRGEFPPSLTSRAAGAPLDFPLHERVHEVRSGRW
jgi:hypothetical protein